MASPAPANPDEPIALVGGMNDVLVTVATVLIQFSVAGLAVDFLQGSGSAVWPVMVANLATACVLAEVFVRRKRLRLTGLVLTCMIVGNVWLVVMSLFPWGNDAKGLEDFAEAASFSGQSVVATTAAASGASAAACALWLRVPIAPALAVLCGLIALVMGVETVATGIILERPNLTSLVCGLTCLGAGIWVDVRARAEGERLPPVGFWFHLASAWLIVHPVFEWASQAGSGTVGAIILYAAFALAALALDRRSLAVSALAYLIAGVTGALEGLTDTPGGSWELIALVASAWLLALALRWDQSRAWLIAQAKRFAPRRPNAATFRS